MMTSGIFGQLAKARGAWQQGQRAGAAEAQAAEQQQRAAQRQREMDALMQTFQRVKLAREQTELDQLRAPKAPQPWKPTTMDDAVRYEASVAEARERAQAKFRPAAVPKDPKAPPAPKDPTDGQAKAAFYYLRARPAHEQLRAYDNPSTLNEISNKAGMLGNWAKTPQGRLLDQASRNWVMTVLRQDSQGTITDDEMEMYRSIYLPVPGDDAATLAQKAEARRVATDGLRGIAGRALPSAGSSGAPMAGGMAGGSGEIDLRAPAAPQMETAAPPSRAANDDGIVAEAVEMLRTKRGTIAEARQAFAARPDLWPRVLTEYARQGRASDAR